MLLQSCGLISSDTMDIGSMDFGDMTQSQSSGVDTSDQALTQATLNETVSAEARDKYTVLKGNGQDTMTLMIYMCGSDLESRSGMATADLQEILNADFTDNLYIVIETGGATKWQNSVISSGTNQRYQLVDGGLKILQDNMGRRSMTDPETLTDLLI